MFKYIGYDLKNDILVATNNESEWALTLGHIPQQCEYFHSIQEATMWLYEHSDAHKKYLEEEWKYFYSTEVKNDSAYWDSLQYYAKTGDWIY